MNSTVVVPLQDSYAVICFSDYFVLYRAIAILESSYSQEVLVMYENGAFIHPRKYPFSSRIDVNKDKTAIALIRADNIDMSLDKWGFFLKLHTKKKTFHLELPNGTHVEFKRYRNSVTYEVFEKAKCPKEESTTS